MTVPAVASGPLSQLSTANAETVGLSSQRQVFKWGRDGDVVVGRTTPVVLAPAPVPGLTDVSLAQLGNRYICALSRAGEVSCQGRNNAQQVVAPPTTQDSPLTRIPLPASARYVENGPESSCAVLTNGEVHCWGRTIGSLNAVQEPALVAGLADVLQVRLTGGSACALLRSGRVSCWGVNDRGQLGSAAGSVRTIPAEVPGLSDVVLLAEGTPAAAHFCAMRRNREVVCWGTNQSGELGDGTTLERSGPVVVLNLPN
jgi:alpha-tubulin suppressor-like RCC1 family protein